MKEKVLRRMVERRRRGFFGWVLLIFFWLANGVMALWLFSAIAQWGDMAKPMTEAEKTGAGLGIAMGLGVIFSIWACVALITGLLAFMTHGRKEIIEIEG